MGRLLVPLILHVKLCPQNGQLDQCQATDTTGANQILYPRIWSQIKGMDFETILITKFGLASYTEKLTNQIDQ